MSEDIDACAAQLKVFKQSVDNVYENNRKIDADKEKYTKIYNTAKANYEAKQALEKQAYDTFEAYKSNRTESTHDKTWGVWQDGDCAAFCANNANGEGISNTSTYPDGANYDHQNVCESYLEICTPGICAPRVCAPSWLGGKCVGGSCAPQYCYTSSQCKNWECHCFAPEKNEYNRLKELKNNAVTITATAKTAMDTAQRDMNVAMAKPYDSPKNEIACCQNFAICESKSNCSNITQNCEAKITNLAADKAAATDKAAADKAATDKAAADKAAADKAAADKAAAAGKAAEPGKASSGNESSGKASSGNVSSGNESSGNESSGNESSGNESTGNELAQNSTNVISSGKSSNNIPIIGGITFSSCLLSIIIIIFIIFMVKK